VTSSDGTAGGADNGISVNFIIVFDVGEKEREGGGRTLGEGYDYVLENDSGGTRGVRQDQRRAAGKGCSSRRHRLISCSHTKKLVCL